MLIDTPDTPKIAFNPLKIGHLTIETPLSLAPMAGQTNHAFRMICREQGDVGLVCTELLSSNAMQNPGALKTTMQMMDWRPEESPFAVQLFGNKPEYMAEAAQFVVDHGADIVDINMGCWVPKVAKKGGGAALLRDVCTATEVVRAVVDTVPSTPVTVKIRSGFTADNPTAIPFAKAAQEVGVKAIAVHARFAEQGFTGTADWTVIKQVKEAVDIPVMGNGDVFTPDDAIRMFEETDCDAVMLGRGALGKPWIFHHIAHKIRTGETLPTPSWEERARIAVHQATLTLATSKFPERKVLLELRGQLCKYCEGLPDAKPIRAKVVRAESLDEIKQAFGMAL